MTAETERKLFVAVERAVKMADGVIVKACEGDNDLLKLMTAEVAKRFADKSVTMLTAEVSAKELKVALHAGL